MTAALFWDLWTETAVVERSQYQDPVFTLNEDKEGYINARKTFVELNDPSGYKWALQYLGDYNHWHALMKCKWFVEAYEGWINELNAKLQSEGIDHIRQIARTSEQEAQRMAAARLLIDQPWSKRKGAGRPSKAEIEANLKQETKKKSEEQADLERIGLLKVVNGNGS